MFWWILLSSIGAALIGYIVVATIAAHRLTTPRRRLPQTTPAQVGLEFENVTFRARGDRVTIAAWHIPAVRAKRAIIIAHGIGGCRSREFIGDSLELMEQLVCRGFTVLAIDLRGHGESGDARMTYGLSERRDVLGAVDWLLMRGYPPGMIGVFGASMGGVAGIGAASEEPAIGALLTDSSCADFPAMMRSHFHAFTNLPSFFLPGTLLMSLPLTGENLSRLRPVHLMGRIERRPTLVIHAAGDQLVPADHARALANAANAELWITDSPRHLGSFRADQHAYSERVIQFFHDALVEHSTVRPADALPVYAPAGERLHMHWYATSHSLQARWEADGAPDVAHPAEDAHEDVGDALICIIAHMTSSYQR